MAIVFRMNPIPKHINGNRQAVRIIDLIQFLPVNHNRTISKWWRQKTEKSADWWMKIRTSMARVHPSTHITSNEWCESITCYECRDNSSSPATHKYHQTLPHKTNDWKGRKNYSKKNPPKKKFTGYSLHNSFKTFSLQPKTKVNRIIYNIIKLIDRSNHSSD